MLTYLFYTAQAYLPRDNTAYNGLDHSTSIVNHENAPQANSLVEVPSSHECQADNEDY